VLHYTSYRRAFTVINWRRDAAAFDHGLSNEQRRGSTPGGMSRSSPITIAPGHALASASSYWRSSLVRLADPGARTICGDGDVNARDNNILRGI
jgi:hypothetical protein